MAKFIDHAHSRGKQFSSEKNVQLFHTHIIVDWSARSKPSSRRCSKDAIWIGRADAEPEYIRTRHGALERLKCLVAKEVDAGRRVLVGFDFPFGYPVGVAKRLTGKDCGLTLWAWLAKQIEDQKDNSNNRWKVATQVNRCYPGCGPFWGRPAQWQDLTEIPARKRCRTYSTKHPPDYRIADCCAKAKSVWQLFYPGSVGSQVLLGLPVLERLCKDPKIASCTKVWPFQTGLQPPSKDVRVVLAEVYPSLLKSEVYRQRKTGEILDRAQVRVNACAFAQLDRQGELAPLFSGPSELTCRKRRLIETEEAWILGLGCESALSG